MTRYYDELARYEREGFEIVVDKTYEDTDPWDQLSECFDSKEQLYADIDSCKYDWFMLRVRVFVEGNELGSAYLGGCLYEDPKEILIDGTAEDMISEALAEAKRNVYPLMKKLQAINEELERVGT
jgi:hypothetical protein